MLLLCFTTKAQLFDSIASSFKHKPKAYGNFETRNSFVTNQHVKVTSIRAGVTFNKQFTLAAGYNWLNSEFKSENQEALPRILKMKYGSLFCEYSFLEQNNFEVTIPVNIGFGSSFYQDDELAKSNKGFILLYEPAMTATYRFWRYFGVGAGIGYRLMLVGNKQLGEQFNSPIYLLKAKLFFGDIYRDVFKKSK